MNPMPDDPYDPFASLKTDRLRHDLAAVRIALADVSGDLDHLLAAVDSTRRTIAGLDSAAPALADLVERLKKKRNERG
jgi:hypothetical protein